LPNSGGAPELSYASKTLGPSGVDVLRKSLLFSAGANTRAPRKEITVFSNDMCK